MTLFVYFTHNMMPLYFSATPTLDSFTSYSYKVGLIRTLVDRAYKINNTWLGLHEDITKLMEILKKESFPCSFNWKSCKPLHYWDPK